MKWIPGKRKDLTIDPHFITCGDFSICKTWHDAERKQAKYTLWRRLKLIGVFASADEAKAAAGTE